MTYQATTAQQNNEVPAFESITLVPVENIDALGGDSDYWKGFAVGVLMVLCGGL
jgi:hypothetical protein